MIDVLLISHGALAAGMRESAEMILGEQERLSVLGLYPGESKEYFTEKLQKAIGEFGDPKNVLVLADLQSGTPYNAALFTVLQDGVTLIAGCNLPLLLDVLSLRDGCAMEDLVNAVCASGRQGIVNSIDVVAEYRRRENQ